MTFKEKAASRRHTFVALPVKESQKAGEGISILEVSAIVGHADPSITMNAYGGLFPNSTERSMYMTQLREQAIELIKEIPEDKIIYVVNILKNVKDLSGQRRKEESAVKRTDNLPEHLEKYRGRLPEDFDYKKELEEARDEKYVDFA